MSGWIKLHRSLLEWEWWDDHNATRLLTYLLCAVNYERKKWQGIVVEPGTLITSFEKISDNTGLTVKQVRSAMKKLENCGEVARKRARKGQAITLTKWEKLQSNELEEGKQMDTLRARRGQGEGKKRATTKESKEYKEIKEGKNIEVHPSFEEFQDYAIDKSYELNLDLDLTKLKAKYLAWKTDNWRTGKGNKIKNWKSTLLNTLPFLQKEKSSAKKESEISRLSQI